MIVGNYDDYDQVTINFAGTNTPEWTAEYIDNPTQQGSGSPVEYTGDTALNINIDGTAYPFEVGIPDPRLNPVPGSGGIVTEVVSAGTFEGRSQFVVGIKGSAKPYSVQVLKDPVRLVLDISS